MKLLKGDDVEKFYKTATEDYYVDSKKSMVSDAYYCIYKIEDFYYGYAVNFSELEVVYKSKSKEYIREIVEFIYNFTEKEYLDRLSKFSKKMRDKFGFNREIAETFKI